MNLNSCAPSSADMGQLIYNPPRPSPPSCVERTMLATASDVHHGFSSVSSLSSGDPALSTQPPTTALLTTTTTPPVLTTIPLDASILQSVQSARRTLRLPYDIIATILEHHIPPSGSAKTRDDIARFASFALVSSEWYAYVAPRLYTDIVFSDVFSSRSQRRLCQTLKTSPRLGAHVRSCSITSGFNNRYDEISLFELPDFIRAVENMTRLAMLQLRSVDVTASLLRSLGQRNTLKTLSLIQCICMVPSEQQTSLAIRFKLQNFTMLGSPLLEDNGVIAKILDTDTLEYLMLDSQVTGTGLHTLRNRSLARLRYLYAEPSRDDTALFCETLARCPALVRLGFSHGSKSLPLDEAPFAQFERVPALGQITHWTGPSPLLPYFLRKGRHCLQHVAMDQLICTDVEDQNASYRELLRPRNLSTSPEVESARIFAIQALVSEPSSLQTLDVVLSSSHSVKEVFGNCRVQLADLRVKCTETEGHTNGLVGASSALSSLTTLREIQITAPPGFSEPEIERDLRRQHEIVERWSRIGSVERVAFSAWLRWHRASQGEWTPLVTARDIANIKTRRWRRRKFKILDWENRLGDALGTKFDCPSRTNSPPPQQPSSVEPAITVQPLPTVQIPRVDVII